MMLANFSIRMFLVGLAAANLAPAALFAQAPPPKKVAELTAAGIKPLTGQQISGLLLGNTVYYTFLIPVGSAPAGTQFTAFYRDARTRVVAPASGSGFQKVEANWWIDGNQICAENRVVRQGQSCQSLYQSPSAVYGCRDGDCQVMMRIVPGNPDKL